MRRSPPQTRPESQHPRPPPGGRRPPGNPPPHRTREDLSRGTPGGAPAPRRALEQTTTLTRRSFFGRVDTLILYNSRPPLGAGLTCTGWGEKKIFFCMWDFKKCSPAPSPKSFFTKSPRQIREASPRLREKSRCTPSRRRLERPAASFSTSPCRRRSSSSSPPSPSPSRRTFDFSSS